MGILEKIGEIEKEIARTQKNKGEITKMLDEFHMEFVLGMAHNMPATLQNV